MLLLSDNALPSVAGLIAGGPIAGSWWGHPKGNEIFNASSELEEHSDVLTLKLIGGKVTYLHRDLWGALIALATSGAPWQTRSIKPEAGALLAEVLARGQVRLDQLHVPELGNAKVMAGAARDLERRLLLHGWQIHTENGSHTKCLATWERWMERARFELPELTLEGARAELDTRLEGLNTAFGGSGRFPWSGRGG
jgi:hypothetical protein